MSLAEQRQHARLERIRLESLWPRGAHPVRLYSASERGQPVNDYQKNRPNRAAMIQKTGPTELLSRKTGRITIRKTG
jgi:hypothetical protein